MTYEDMNLAQLKALCKDRKLGTGRSKQDLIEKLKASDALEPDDTDLTEEQIDITMEEVESVDIEPAPEVKSKPTSQDESSDPTIFRISFSHSGALLDSNHESFRRQAWELAKGEGFEPYGGPLASRLVKSENGQLTYEVEVH